MRVSSASTSRTSGYAECNSGSVATPSSHGHQDNAQEPYDNKLGLPQTDKLPKGDDKGGNRQSDLNLCEIAGVQRYLREAF